MSSPTAPGWRRIATSIALWLLVATAILTAFTLLVGACGAAAPA